jgi:GNAT superfamily N-acetyltransferase
VSGRQLPGGRDPGDVRAEGPPRILTAWDQISSPGSSPVNDLERRVPMPSVTVVLPTHRHRAIATLTLAFANDPVARWVWPDPHVYTSYFPRIIEAFGGGAFESGTANAVADLAAVALWLPPHVHADEETMTALIEESAAASVRPDLDGFFGQMADLHPSFDHWYLPLAGVDPPAQGRGLGSVLLGYAIKRCDEDGLPAYLEATSPRSRDLYARLGFEQIGVIQQGGSPPMWPMLRRPA